MFPKAKSCKSGCQKNLKGDCFCYEASQSDSDNLTANKDKALNGNAFIEIMIFKNASDKPALLSSSVKSSKSNHDN